MPLGTRSTRIASDAPLNARGAIQSAAAANGPGRSPLLPRLLPDPAVARRLSLPTTLVLPFAAAHENARQNARTTTGAGAAGVPAGADPRRIREIVVAS